MNLTVFDSRRGFAAAKVKFDAEMCRIERRGALERCLPNDLPPQLRQRLQDVLGLSSETPALSYGSNLTSIGALSRGIGEAWTREWELHANRELEFLTITPPGWWVSEFSPVLNLARWRAEISRWMSRLGFTGTGVIEPAPFQKIRHERGGRGISFHFHAVGYTDDPFSYRGRVEALKEHLGPANTGQPSVVSKAIASTLSDVRYVSEYTVKTAGHAKNTVARRDGEGTLLRNVRLPRQLAMRVQEMMSFFKLQDMIVARGKVGQHCKRQALLAVGREAIARFPDRMSDRSLLKFWRGFWDSFAAATKSKRKRDVRRRYRDVTVVRRHLSESNVG